MQHGDIAETDEKLRITPDCREIQPVGDAVRPLAAARGEDRPNLGITERGIEIRQSLLIRPGKIVLLAKGMFAEIDVEPPALQNFSVP